MSKILVIDDDIDLCEVTKAFFTPKGYQVEMFSEAGQALKAVLLGQLQPDVILVDLKMPMISGLEFIQKLKEQKIGIPVIVITAHRNVDTAMESIEAGAFDYVIKPLNFPQLMISVERALRFSMLRSENSTLKSAIQIKEGSELSEIRGKSPALLKVLDLAKRVAASKSNIYISGESGTGKEVLARSIHRMSGRSHNRFVAINCSAIPENLLESELFGHSKGAFTGATEKRIGLFQEAEGGTLFLDEIGDMPLALQAKLLRVIQDKKVKRVGENHEQELDLRIISATHKDLRSEIKKGLFREDLFFRLNVIPLHLPPLRERLEDILPLAEFFLKKYASLNEVNVKGFSRDAVAWLVKNSWKGNVRELENTIERAVVISRNSQIELDDLTRFDHELSPGLNSGEQEKSWNEQQSAVMPLDSIVKKYISHVLHLNRGAKDKTAKDLRIDRKTLYRKLQEIQQEEHLGATTN
ncbi:MAG: sigma-54-dependent transcriptional regulator [Bdellovibrionales bacterium]